MSFMILLRKFFSLVILVLNVIICIIDNGQPIMAVQYFIIGLVVDFVLLFWAFYLARKAFSIGWLIIGPLLVLGSGAFFYLFVGNVAARIIIAVLTLSISWFLVEESIRYVYWPNEYKEKSLENISSYAQIFVIYAVFNGLFYINTFIFVQLWVIVIVSIAISFAVLYQLVQVNRITNSDNWLFIIIVGLIIGELVWVVNFLPTIYYVNAILVTIVFYILSGLGRQILMTTLKAKSLLRYLLVGVIGIIIILVSSQWT